MKNKRIIIIITIVVVLGLLTLFVSRKLSLRTTMRQDFQIEVAAIPGGVNKIFMADKENHQLLLENSGDTLWMVDGQYEASQHMVELMLETLAEMRIRNRVNKAAVENVVTQMAARSIKVEVYYNDYRINWFKGKFHLFPYEHCEVIYVGHDTPDMLATYMYREGDDVPYLIHIPGFRGCLAPRFVVDPYAWRSHSIVDLPIQEIEAVELTIPSSPDESYAVRRDGEGFVFYKGNGQRVDGFDTARVAQLLSSFVHLNFDEYAKIVPQVELDTTFSKSPRTILHVTDTRGKTSELKTYIKYNNPEDLRSMPDTTMYQIFDMNRLYAVLNNKDTVLIQYYVFDNILQPASFFLGSDKSLFAR